MEEPARAGGAAPAGLALNPGAPPDDARFLDGDLSRHLKPHQERGVRFMWERCVGPAEEGDARGCVLADHMGLGKTLQLICVLKSWLSGGPPRRTALVIAPAFVLSNWLGEIERWLPRDRALRPRTLPAAGGAAARLAAVAAWQREGGALLVGYEMFRMLAGGAGARAEFVAALCDPGPGLLVLDEAHRLKEPRSQLYKAMGRIRTRRRVLASGYPVQNRLDEYWALVTFARPSALGSYDRFRAFFERPIVDYLEGAAGDAGADGDGTHDGATALRRAYVLQRELEDVVLRRGTDELGDDLPPRTDWVVECALSPVQRALYDAFEQSAGLFAAEADAGEVAAPRGELAAYHTALAIVNHPDIVHGALAEEERLFDDGGDDGGAADALAGGLGAAPPAKRARPEATGWRAPEVVAREASRAAAQKARDDARREKQAKKFRQQAFDDYEGCGEWSGFGGSLRSWARPVFQDGDRAAYDTDVAAHSGKAAVALAVMAAAKLRRERVIVFTQTLGTLAVLERLIDARNAAADGGAKLRYARIDGATPAAQRSAIVDDFNAAPAAAAAATPAPAGGAAKPARRLRPAFAPGGRKRRPRPPERAVTPPPAGGRLGGGGDGCDVLLMSIKAGGEGINLTGANRVVLFDVCWNPCFDRQAMCRAHRFGQKRPVFVYRLVAPRGTMEAKVLRQQRRKELLVREVVERQAPADARFALRPVFGPGAPEPPAGGGLGADPLLRDVVDALGADHVAAVHEDPLPTLGRGAAPAEPGAAALSAGDKAAAVDEYRAFCERASAPL